MTLEIRGNSPSGELDRGIQISFGEHLPNRILENEEIGSWRVQTKGDNLLTAARILQKTGVERRFIADEGPLEMALAAAESALAGQRKIDGLIVTASYPDSKGINFADQIRRELRIDVDSLLDVYTACSGFVSALTYLKENEARFNGRTILLVSTEKHSDKVADLSQPGGIELDPTLSQTIFSDGALAMKFIYGKDIKVLGYENRAFPESDALIKMPLDPNLMRHPFLTREIPRSETVLQQEGKEVYRVVREVVPPLITTVLESTEAESSDIKLVIPHQASIHMIKALSEELPDLIFILDMRDGNFSSASIPKALMKALEGGEMEVFVGGKLKRERISLGKKDKVVLAGFGAGLFASVAVIEFG